MEKELKISKVKTAVNCLLALAAIVICGLFIFIDRDNPILNILTFFTFILAMYYLFVYGFDLFDKNAGILINENGVKINFSFFKNIQLSWDEIVSIDHESAMVLIKVENYDKYDNKLPLIIRLLVKTYKTRFKTIFVLHGYLLNIKVENLYAMLKESMDSFK
jgi:hypothetical protein